MAHRTTGRVLALVLAPALFVLGGCSHFDSEWLDAQGRPPYGIDGQWRGSWTSLADGHHGPLLCAIHDVGNNHYDASFNATYGGFFHFPYDAKLVGRPEGKLVRLQGQTDLGWPLGIFRYEGAADLKRFYCTYSSKEDHGYFSLARSDVQPPTTALAAEK